jgi:hypothetical protein
MMSKTFSALVLMSLSAASVWAVGADSNACVGQNQGCLPPLVCGTIGGGCMVSQISCGTYAHWTTHEYQTTTTTTANSVTTSTHSSDSSHTISTGPAIWMCTNLWWVGCPGHCHTPIIPLCGVGCNSD